MQYYVYEHVLYQPLIFLLQNDKICNCGNSKVCVVYSFRN